MLLLKNSKTSNPKKEDKMKKTSNKRTPERRLKKDRRISNVMTLVKQDFMVFIVSLLGGGLP
jgi:hypothetical protein